MPKYVVVDWGSWGIEVQSSSKIIIADPFDVREGNECSLQGRDPATKRPMLFHGHVLAVFDTKKEAENKVTELVSHPEIEEESTTDGPRPRREPKPSKKKLAALENADENSEKMLDPGVISQQQKNLKRKAVVEKDGDTVSGKEVKVSQKQKRKKSRKAEVNNNDNDIVFGQEQLVSQKQKSKSAEGNYDKEIVTVANAKRVQKLLMRRQQITVSDDENTDETEITGARKVHVEEVSGSEKTSNRTNRKEFVQISPPSHQSSDGYFNSTQHQQSMGVINSSPPPSGENFGSPQYQQPSGVITSGSAVVVLHPSSGANFSTPEHQQTSDVSGRSPPLHQSSANNLSTPQHQQTSDVSGSSPPLRQSSANNLSTPQHQQPSVVTNNSPPLSHSSGLNFSTPQHRQHSDVTAGSSPPLYHSFSSSLGTPQYQQSSGGNFSTPQHQQSLHVGVINSSPTLHQSSGGSNSSIRRALTVTQSSPTLRQPSDNRNGTALATPPQEFSFLRSLHHCSDFDISDLDLAMSPNYQLETGNHTTRDDVQQREPAFSNLPTACSGCQPLLMALNKRLCSLEAEFERMKRKQKKGKVVIESDVEKQDPNEERFNGLKKEALVRLIEDASDAKSAVEALARQLFTSDELQNSSVTGFQCNKDYEARPGLSPSRRGILESIVLKKGFPAATRSSVRKDLGLVLKKARANKENKAKCKGQEQRKL